MICAIRIIQIIISATSSVKNLVKMVTTNTLKKDILYGYRDKPRDKPYYLIYCACAPKSMHLAVLGGRAQWRWRRPGRLMPLDVKLHLLRDLLQDLLLLNSRGHGLTGRIGPVSVEASRTPFH